MPKLVKHIILFSILSFHDLSFAGGPISLGGTDGNTPVNYLDPNITLHVESGDLGVRDNAAADAILQRAIDLLNAVNTSTISLNLDQTALAIEVDADNSIDLMFDYEDALNPVIYDDDGEIIDKLFGLNASDTKIGFAGSVYYVDTGHYIEGFAVINGRLSLTDDGLTLLFVHEIAHVIGLDHTQVNIDNLESEFDSPGFCTTANRENYPVMYPISCRTAATLHSDDISALSALYPAANINDSFGILQGRFVDESGGAILGANIWLENIRTGETYSIISDYLMQGTGYYKLYLPAGTYTLHANSINKEFVDGSRVGPYTETVYDASFKSPHPIIPVTYQDSDGNDQVVSLSANQTIDITFSITGVSITATSSDNNVEDDSYSDLFGATSHTTLLLLLTIMMVARRKATTVDVLQ